VFTRPRGAGELGQRLETPYAAAARRGLTSGSGSARLDLS
jgi:hypothetical protein